MQAAGLLIAAGLAALRRPAWPWPRRLWGLAAVGLIVCRSDRPRSHRDPERGVQPRRRQHPHAALMASISRGGRVEGLIYARCAVRPERGHTAATITRVGRTGQLTRKPLWQQDAYRMIQRRATAAGIKTRIGNHTFRATGITAYLQNQGTLEIAQQIRPVVKGPKGIDTTDPAYYTPAWP